MIFDFDSKSIDFNSRNQKIKQMISKYRETRKEFVVVTQIEESRYIIEYFGFSGNILSVMEVSESKLNYLLDGLYEVIPRKSGVYPGTEENLKVLKYLSKAECKFTLTALFYDNDEELKKFMQEGLKYSYGGDSLERIPKEILNDFKKCGINVFYTADHRKIITKFIPIDSRKLKSMSSSERKKVEDLLKQCTAKIVIFDCSNSELDKIFKDVYTEDREETLKVDVTLNYVFKLISSVSEEDFLGFYTYNQSKITKEQIDDRFCKFSEYVGYLREGKAWWHDESVKILDMIVFPACVKEGLDIINQREPFAKEYIEKHCESDIVGKIMLNL